MLPMKDIRSIPKKTDWLLEHIPGITYALDRTTNYIFSNGLTTGDASQNTTLDKWLFGQKNRLGATNYSVLQQAVKYAHVYGEWGLRWYDGNIYDYKTGHFGLLISTEDGVQSVDAYFVRRDGKEITSDIKTDDWGLWTEYSDIERYFEENGLILLSPADFCVIRNDPTELHGTPTLLMDKERIDLLLSTYSRLNYDIDYDGPGRVFFWEESGYVSDENGVSTTTELLNNSPVQKEARLKRAKEEVEELAKKIKTAGSDSVGVLSRALSKDVLRIPRVTKATEFFGWLEDEGKIISQLLGMSAVLLEVGDWSGNVSMGKIIDNAMLNTIIPMREKYAIQFSEFIASHIGVAKVYFDLYDMQQVKNINDERDKVASTILKLSKVEDNESVAKLVDEMTTMIRNSMYNEEGNLTDI